MPCRVGILFDLPKEHPFEVVSHAHFFRNCYVNTRNQFPPADLLAASGTPASLPTTPAWALAATAPAEWVLAPQEQQQAQEMIVPASAPVEQQQQQQETPFDDATDANWESLSMASIASDEDIVMEEDGHEPVAPLQETHFYESYPLAITAAGLGAASTKNRSLVKQQQRAAGRRRSLLVRLSFLIALVAAMAAAWSLGYLDGRVAQQNAVAPISRKASQPTPTPVAIAERLVPTSRSIMVREGSSSRPTSEQLLQKYMLDGIVHSIRVVKPYVNSSVETLQEWKSAVVATPEPHAMATPQQPKLKILRPLVRRLQKLGNLWKKIASVLFRGGKKGHPKHA